MKLSKYLQKYCNKNNNNNNIIFLKFYFIYLSYKNKNSMGGYFSRQNNESIEIINEIDHVHVIVSNSDKKNESCGGADNQTDQTVQDSQDSQGNQDSQNNQDSQGNVLKTASIELDTNNQDKNNNISQIDFNKYNYNDTICKKNLKKRKCKKNKKKHLQ